MLTKSNPANSLTWCVLVQSTGDNRPRVEEWCETEAQAIKVAEGTLRDASREDWGVTDVWVVQCKRTGSANR